MTRHLSTPPRRTMATTLVGAGVLTAVLLMTASCSRAPLNVVLISLDTLRADRMSLYAAERQTTLAIDALARRGIHFTNAFSPSPWTLPAHAAMLTGRYPSSLSDDFSGQLYRVAPMLSTILGARGYRTAAVTGGAFVSKSFGADVGFDSFQTGEVTDAVGWIARRPREPFFLFFHTYLPHMPYTDRRYTDGLDAGRFADIYRGDDKEWMEEHLAIACGSVAPTDAEKAYLLALYDGGVAAADDAVGKLIAALEDGNLLDRTIVIVTSDHGEEFWDHTGRGAYHGHTLYAELLRVPLIWYEPGLRRPGAVRSETVSLIDIVPTLLARLGLPAPAGIDGVDLGPLLDDRAWTVDRLLFGEAVRHGPPRQSALSSAAKLIVVPDPTVQNGEGRRCAVPVLEPRELYLRADAAERQNSVGTHPQIADALAGALKARAAEAPAHRTPTSRTSIDDATRERLKALGYAAD